MFQHRHTNETYKVNLINERLNLHLELKLMFFLMNFAERNVRLHQKYLFRPSFNIGGSEIIFAIYN